MTHHDDIIAITLYRGELAVSLGEAGYMVNNWRKFAAALDRELRRATPNRDDGHSGSSAMGDLLIEGILSNLTKQELAECGVVGKPDSGKNECWPFEEKWF